MKTKSIKFLSVCFGIMLALAIVTMMPATATQASANNALQISASDFNEGAIAVSTSYYKPDNAVASGLQYKFKDGKSLALSGKTGIAFRIKNPNSVDYNLNQIRLHVKGSTLVYSTNNATFTCLWANGEQTTTSHGARYVVVPANFDGYLLIPFTQMNYLRPSNSNTWVWNANTKLSASGEGDLGLPTGEISEIAYYGLRVDTNREIVIGAHATYTQTMDGYEINDKVYADVATAVKPSGEPLMNINYVYPITVNFVAGSENVTVNNTESVVIPYGYTATAPAEIASGYSLKNVSVKASDGTGTSYRTLTFTNDLKTTGPATAVATVNVTNKIERMDELDGSALVMDPDKATATGANYGGPISVQNKLNLANQDGLAVRVRNTLSVAYPINTIYVNSENGQNQWSLLNSVITYVPIEGETTTYCRGTGEANKFRNTEIPANFDGYMVIPFNQLVNTRLNNGSHDWSRTESYHLVKGSEDPVLAYPVGSFNSFNFYIATGFNSAGANELILGDVYTYTGEAAEFVVTAHTPLARNLNYAFGNNGYLSFTHYSEATTKVNVQVNGKAGTEGFEMKLNGAKQEYTLTYGESIVFNPEMKNNCSFAGIEVISGESKTLLTTATYVNLNKFGGEVILNFLAEGTIKFDLGEENVDLSDKNALKVHVNNTSAKAIDYSIILTDGTANYVAGNSAGIASVNGINKYSNVFSIPAGFEGDVYIPFNYYRSAYGKPQVAPFSYTEGNKPASVLGQIYLSCESEHAEAELLAMFTAWEFVTELPAITAPSTENANLYKNGNTDFIGGNIVDVTLTDKADNAGNAERSHAVRFNVESLAVSFDLAGMAIRVRNLGAEDFGIRTYFTTTANTIFVPQASNKYILIDANGEVVEGSHHNRNIVIPAGFDGTIVINFVEFANDNVPSGKTENVNRADKTLKFIDFYTAGTVGEGVFFGKTVGLIAYDGTVTASDLLVNASGHPKMGKVSIAAVEQKQIVCEAEGVTLSQNTVMFGITEITLSVAEGMFVTSIEACDAISVKANENGSYTLIVNYTYATEGELFVNVITAEAHLVNISAGEHGSVLYKGFEAGATITVAKNADFEIQVVAEIGYRATVTANGSEITAGENNVYVIPANTTEIAVTYASQSAKLTTAITGKTSVTLNGEALTAGELEMLQGVYALNVSISAGYQAVVTLNGEEVAKNEGAYSIVLDGDKQLAITVSAIEYTITYDLDRGTASNPTTYTVEDEIVLGSATKEGYNFKGWYVIENGEQVGITKIEKGSTGNLTIYAEFELASTTDSSSVQTSEETKKGCMSDLSANYGLVAVLALVALAIVIKRKQNA